MADIQVSLHAGLLRNNLKQTPISDKMAVQRQMKCAAEDRSLNREWTRIHANSGSDKVWVHFERLVKQRGP